MCECVLGDCYGPWETAGPPLQRRRLLLFSQPARRSYARPFARRQEEARREAFRAAAEAESRRILGEQQAQDAAWRAAVAQARRSAGALLLTGLRSRLALLPTLAVWKATAAAPPPWIADRLLDGAASVASVPGCRASLVGQRALTAQPSAQGQAGTKRARYEANWQFFASKHPGTCAGVPLAHRPGRHSTCNAGPAALRRAPRAAAPLVLLCCFAAPAGRVPPLTLPAGPLACSAPAGRAAGCRGAHCVRRRALDPGRRGRAAGGAAARGAVR